MKWQQTNKVMISWTSFPFWLGKYQKSIPVFVVLLYVVFVVLFFFIRHWGPNSEFQSLIHLLCSIRTLGEWTAWAIKPDAPPRACKAQRKLGGAHANDGEDGAKKKKKKHATETSEQVKKKPKVTESRLRKMRRDSRGESLHRRNMASETSSLLPRYIMHVHIRVFVPLIKWWECSIYIC